MSDPPIKKSSHPMKKFGIELLIFNIRLRVQWTEKKRTKVFCSHFMSFYPIDFIFIGWVGYDKNLFRVPRNFDFKPTNPIFSPKRQMNHFRKWPFLGVWCRKLTFRENGVMDMANMLDSGQNSPNTTFPNIFSLISAISADLSKSQKNHILKKSRFFW